MKKRYGLLMLLLVMALMMTGCAGDNASMLDKSVIRVGSVSYTYGDLLDAEEATRAYYDELAQAYALYGLEAPVYTAEDVRNEALNNLAMQAVVLDKANQMKISELSSAEKAEVSVRTDAAMAEYRAGIAPALTFPEGATEAERAALADQALAEMGITRAKVYRTECQNYIIEKTRAWAVSGVKVTEEEFAAAFEAQVESEKAAMEEDPYHYGLMRRNGEAPLYAPAGYREVEWILLEPDAEDQERLGRINSALYDAQVAAEEREEQAVALLGPDADLDGLVAQVEVTLNDVTDPTEITVQGSAAAFTGELSPEAADAVTALAEARAVASAYEEQLALATEAANERIAPEAEELLRRLQNGEEWSRVQTYYTDDPELYYGSPVVCAGFPYVPEAYVAAALALEEPGDWSAAVYVDGYGCFILRYAGDVPEGPVDRESVREVMTADLLAARQEESYVSTLDIWWNAATSRMVVNYSLLEK